MVVDEAHVYEGAFGAHVAMVLARLKRVCRVASSQYNTTSTGSATFIGPKHFFVFNPPILDVSECDSNCFILALGSA